MGHIFGHYVRFFNKPTKDISMNWQPIETAPKDGTEVLGLWKRSGRQSNGYGVVWYENDSWREFDYECLVTNPTHWMPLPPPPTE